MQGTSRTAAQKQQQKQQHDHTHRQATASFMFAAQMPSSSEAGAHLSSLPVAAALDLAQQVSRSGLLPQLAEAVDSAVLQYASSIPPPGPHVICKSAALLQLCLAVARMWPQGSLKSAAAGALAAPTARLAVALMREHLLNATMA
jgi:hypothetical protein